ncbi:MAG: MoaD/ThiS family protein [Nitrospinota bacterium]|nr:MoaD/ThiS family protein [Nitrospinota bacterium]
MAAVEIKVSYLGPLRRVVGCKEERLRLEPPVTVRSVLDHLICERGDHLKDVFYNIQGWLDPGIMFLIDGQRPEAREGLDTPISGEEEIQIVMGVPMSGG